MLVGVAIGVAVGVTVKLGVRTAAGVTYEQLEMHLINLKEIQNGDWSGYLN